MIREWDWGIEAPIYQARKTPTCGSRERARAFCVKWKASSCVSWSRESAPAPHPIPALDSRVTLGSSPISFKPVFQLLLIGLILWSVERIQVLWLTKLLALC